VLSWDKVDSERSDEWIDFTMMCFIIFLSVYTISSRNSASIFNFSILFDRKVNLVGALGKSKFPIVFKSARKNKIKIKE